MPDLNPSYFSSLIPSTNRIVIGDVGSGKTIVAFITALVYLKGLKYGEISLLSPTEVLAYQHYIKLLELVDLQKLDWVDCVFLSGKGNYFNGQKLPPAKLKKAIEKTQEKTNYKIFWVGTHALLFSDLVCPDLVMVDEQHRFGVRQREKLTKKQLELQPHFISFTATPIPRTLALTIYNTLQPIFLETLAGRNPILTTIESDDKLVTKIFGMIQNTLNKNQKVYVICPAVEEVEDIDEKKALWSVNKVAKILKAKFGETVMSVHGKIADKKDILTEFKTSIDKNILVATTVVEVGVDVGLASLVVIMNAERFGLSALHQIRGRVGRNNFDTNECVLVTQKEYTKSRRLGYLCQYQDGFKLSQKDLELRGAGDVVGSSQSGFSDEINSLIGLNPKLYEELNSVIDKLNLEKLDDLPRLKNYLEKEKNRVWEE